MLTLDRITVALAALLFLGLGAAFTLWPVPMAAVVGIELHSATALTDLRAVYGGMNLGLGIYFIIAFTTAGGRRSALTALIAIFAGLGTIRVVGIAVDGPQDPITYVLLGGEVVGLAMSVAARLGIRRLHKGSAG
jgi:hypothetical protein